jgi:hypothetical protein
MKVPLARQGCRSDSMLPSVIVPFADETSAPAASRIVIVTESRPRPGSPASTAITSNL